MVSSMTVDTKANRTRNIWEVRASWKDRNGAVGGVSWYAPTLVAMEAFRELARQQHPDAEITVSKVAVMTSKDGIARFALWVQKGERNER